MTAQSDRIIRIRCGTQGRPSGYPLSPLPLTLSLHVHLFLFLSLRLFRMSGTATPTNSGEQVGEVSPRRATRASTSKGLVNNLLCLLPLYI